MDQFGNPINQNYDPQYRSPMNYNSNNFQSSNLSSRSLTNHFYKLSTQTNMIIGGYILLMGVNHMILGSIVYNKDNTMNPQTKNWLFATVFFCTIINCFILLWLKEKKRPVVQTTRGRGSVAPILFGIFQVIILICTIAVAVMSTPKPDTVKQIMTIITFLALNISVILSTVGFASSVCSLDRGIMRGLPGQYDPNA